MLKIPSALQAQIEAYLRGIWPGPQENRKGNRRHARGGDKELVIQYLRKFGPTSREQVEELLFSKLPDLLSIEQKRNKVKNLLTELRSKDRSIRCARKGPASFWELIDAKLGK